MSLGAPRIAVIDYGIGNLASAHKAFVHLGVDAVLTNDANEIANADGVVLPGVGNFGACMRALRAMELEAVTTQSALDDRPFLGICVGMQMLFEGSDEAPDVVGLGVVPGRVRSLPSTVKLPQIGWNTIEPRTDSEMLQGLGRSPWLYFVHTYAAFETNDDDVGAWCEYGVRFACAVERSRLWATQFHPEKSTTLGLKILSNFAELCGASS